VPERPVLVAVVEFGVPVWGASSGAATRVERGRGRRGGLVQGLRSRRSFRSSSILLGPAAPRRAPYSDLTVVIELLGRVIA
jgi:hypothetical protein